MKLRATKMLPDAR